MELKQKIIFVISVVLVVILGFSKKDFAVASKAKDAFKTENIIPWSIVAFDSKNRDYKERVLMVKQLGFKRYAFGGKPTHLATMKEEWLLAKKENIRISAVWLYLNPEKDKPGKLRDISEEMFSTLEEVGLKTQIWVGFNPIYFEGLTDKESLRRATEMVNYLAQRAEKIGCKVALYNHGGWFGDVKNQIKIIKSLPDFDIGVIYNFHHAHAHLDTFNEDIHLIMPYVWCVNLNGMKAEGPKIITIGEGDLEASMLQTIVDTNYKGPYGILGHVKGGDAEEILSKNLIGLHKLVENIDFR